MTVQDHISCSQNIERKHPNKTHLVAGGAPACATICRPKKRPSMTPSAASRVRAMFSTAGETLIITQNVQFPFVQMETPVGHIQQRSPGKKVKMPQQLPWCRYLIPKSWQLFFNLKSLFKKKLHVHMFYEPTPPRSHIWNSSIKNSAENRDFFGTLERSQSFLMGKKIPPPFTNPPPHPKKDFGGSWPVGSPMRGVCISYVIL